MIGPDPTDVADLSHLLDLTDRFDSNDQRARYLLTSNWMRERGGAAAERSVLILRRHARVEQRTLPGEARVVPASRS